MESQPDEACTNESLAASDVAVGGSVDGRNNNTGVSPMVVVAAPAAEAKPEDGAPPTSRKHTHFRKRALSTATNGTTGSNGFENGESLGGALSASGMSLLANSLNPMTSTGMGSGGEGSIVSFGLNFNFDSTSSPSNSDSGEGDKGDGKDGSDGEVKADGEKEKAEANVANGAPSGRQSSKKTSNGSGGSGSNNKKKAKTNDGPSPSANANSKENSESASDSGQDQDYNSGGSAASGSGNDGSSGGKSTISSLTTSSNQEWMASQNKGAKDAAAGEGNAKKSEGDANLPKAVSKDGAASGGKKRKKAPQGKTEGANDENSTGGYNTDEEQWGGKINNKGDGGVGNSIVHKQHHVVTTATGNSDPSSLTDSNIVRQSKAAGPPLKQARFSIDQAPHPRAVPSAETSAQMGLSSLSSDTPMPSAALNGRAALPSLMSAALISSSNPSAQAPVTTSAPKPRAKRGASGKHHSATLDPKKREERNAREKERSCRIAKQIDELRSLLSRGGVIVAKGTKSSVLSEAANYINLLQQQQVQWEMDRQAMLNKMQEVGASASVVNSQGQLPQSMPSMDPNGMMTQPPQMVSVAMPPNPHAQRANAFDMIGPNDYKFIFDNSAVGMAIASMGGAYVDCNDNFCKLSGYSKQEVCSMTIFNMTSRNDLQHAFDLISQMITPNIESPNQDESKSIILQGAVKSRNDLGLSISLIKGSQGIGRCFCVTLVRILSTDKSRPDVISVEMELPVIPNKNGDIGFGASPAYTSG